MDKHDILSEKIKFVSELVSKYNISSKENIAKNIGKNSFLDSNNLKFLVKNPSTDNFDCNYIFTAFIRASFWESKSGSNLNNKVYYSHIKSKAKNLFKNHKCEKVIDSVILNKANKLFSIIDFL